jgi:hypothetical protein
VCEIGETDEPLVFGVLPLRVTRRTDLHAGGRAAMEVIGSTGRRAWLPGWQAVGERERDSPHACTVLTNVSSDTAR